MSYDSIKKSNRSVRYLSINKHNYYDFNRRNNSYVKYYLNYRNGNSFLPDIDIHSVTPTDKDSISEFMTKYQNLLQMFLDVESAIDDHNINDFYTDGVLNYIFLITRIYVDCWNIFNYFQESLDVSAFKLLDNPANVHAELNLLNYLIANNVPGTNFSRIGLSKLSCVLCYDVFEQLDLSHLLPGSHGLLYISKWKVPFSFVDQTSQQWIRYFTKDMFAKIYQICDDTDFQIITSRFIDETPLKMRSPLSSETIINNIAQMVQAIFDDIFGHIDYNFRYSKIDYPNNSPYIIRSKKQRSRNGVAI